MPVQPVTNGAAAATFAPQGATPAAASGPTSFAGRLAQASATRRSSADTPDSVLDSKKVPKGEKTTPVEGHRYSEVVAGPRNGMFVNTSGNERHGMAFVKFERDGREYHVYGTGKDRLVVCLKRRPRTDDADTVAKAAPKTTTPVTDTAPSGTTGAASAARS